MEILLRALSRSANSEHMSRRELIDEARPNAESPQLRGRREVLH